MSGATIAYSSNIASSLNGDQISAMCIAPSLFGLSSYWNNFFFGTSNGNLYNFNEGTNTIRQVTVTGYTGALNGPITSLTTDPAGKYLFLGSPSDGKLLRLGLSQFNRTGAMSVDSNIYVHGTNTGGIVVNSQNTVYFITANGNAISTVNNYGLGLVNLVYQQAVGSNSLFAGVALTQDESRLFTTDYYTGNLYYYDFTSGQSTLFERTVASVDSRIQGLALLSSNDILFTKTRSIVPGVYLYDIEMATSVCIAGGGSNTLGTSARGYQFINPNQIVLDPNGNLYVTSLDPFSNQLFTKIEFQPFVRSTIAAQVPQQKFVNCGLPLPGFCKKAVIPFNPREYWGFAPSQKIPTKRASPADVRLSCINVATILCPTIPPSRVFPGGSNPPIPPVDPVYPVETATAQYTQGFVSTGTMTSLRPPSTISVVTVPDAQNTRVITPLVFGPQGYIYSMTRAGVLTVLTTSGQTVSPSVEFTFRQSSAVSTPVVVSATGLAAFVTDPGMLIVINQNGTLVFNYALDQQIAGAPVFIDTQYLLVLAYGNSITAWNIVGWSNVWEAGLANDQFKSSLTTDGISVFAGTVGGNVVSYSVNNGSFYWSYSTGSTLPIQQPPFISGNLLVTFKTSNIYVIDKTTTRGGGANDTIITLSGIGTVQSTPLLFTDQVGTTWVYFTTTSNQLYAAGGFLGIANPYIDSSGGNVTQFWRSSESNILPGTTPVIDGTNALYVCGSPGFVYKYIQPTTYPSTVIASNTTNGTVYNNVSGSIFTSPILSSQNQLSFTSYDASYRNYIYTISSA